YIRIKGQDRYLYRAVDSTGQTIDFLLTAKRDAAAAKRFFRKTLLDPANPQPRVINVDPLFTTIPLAAPKRATHLCVANSKSRGNRCLGTARDSFAKNACGPKTPCFQSIATGFGGPGEPQCGARNVVLHGSRPALLTCSLT